MRQLKRISLEIMLAVRKKRIICVSVQETIDSIT